jgi:hypothetical protein
VTVRNFLLILIIPVVLAVCPAPLQAYRFEDDVLVFELWAELEPVVHIPEGVSGGAGSGEENPENGDAEDGGAIYEQEGQPYIPDREDPLAAGPGGRASGPDGGSDPGAGDDGSGPLTSREAVERVLEEARIVVSGMLYGYRVEYTPLDRARQVNERFVVEPIARIEKGDPRLRTLDTRIEDGRFYARFRYDMAEHQVMRRASWKSNTIPSVMAVGTVPLYEGYRGKFASFEEAIKQGLRNYLRPREYNKPREIVADVLFLEPPGTMINAGGYHAKVRMKLRIEEVVPYGAY